jgi:carboxyl-terminal processing protease
MKFIRSFLITLGIALLVFGAFLSGYALRDWQQGDVFRGGTEHSQNTDASPILDEAKKILLENGLKDPPPAPALEYGMIRGMLQAYDDPFTVFVEPPQNELQGNALAGKYGGIGAQLENSGGYWTLYPFPDGPARQAGIQDGDRLLAVDGVDMRPSFQGAQAATPATEPGSTIPATAVNADVVQAALRGEVGKAVKLSLGRAPDYTPFEVSVKRAEIALPSVTWRLVSVAEIGDLGAQTGISDPGYKLGVIKVNLAAASTSDEIQRAVKDLKGRGAMAYALDLRDNPGGLLNAGIDMARLFLKEGVVMQEQYRGREVKAFEVESPGPLADLPLVVLINGGTASASEITAGALQKNQRALLIGTPSLGKRTIQLMFNLKDGSSLHVTAARWWIPGEGEGKQATSQPGNGGKGTTGAGITPLQPDIVVDAAGAPAGTDPFIVAAFRYFLKQ